MFYLKRKVKVEIVSSVRKKIQLSTNILSCTNPTAGKQHIHRTYFFGIRIFLMFIISILVTIKVVLCSSDVYTGNREGSILTQVTTTIVSIFVTIVKNRGHFVTTFVKNCCDNYYCEEL